MRGFSNVAYYEENNIALTQKIYSNAKVVG